MLKCGCNKASVGSGGGWGEGAGKGHGVPVWREPSAFDIYYTRNAEICMSFGLWYQCSMFALNL